MTEAQIERKAERAMDKLDRRFLAGELTTNQYNQAVRAIEEQAAREYRTVEG